MTTLHQRAPASIAAAITSLLHEYILDSNVKILGIDNIVVTTSTFASSRPRRLYVFQIRTNDATYVRGDSNLFKGGYKERVEAVADMLVKEVEPEASAHIEILGPESESPDRLIALESLIESGRLDEKSPLTLTARRFGLTKALVRGRHLIGPSPALASFVRTILQRDNSETVIDFFSGTGIVSHVACSSPSVRAVHAIEQDPRRVAELTSEIVDKRLHVVCGDALEVELPGRSIDLVVADPYYESAFSFLRRRAAWLKEHAKVLVFASGGVEHPSWNERIEEEIRSIGFLTKSHTEYGQAILECKPL
jgi:16S rRNA G966 N2-methylase RsmD